MRSLLDRVDVGATNQSLRGSLAGRDSLNLEELA